MREFEGGATRDDDKHKPDYEAYLSPHVIRVYGEYMLRMSDTPNGRRAGDNWQSGFGLAVVMKSLWRHLVHAWTLHRAPTRDVRELQDALCGVIFNASAYLHELGDPPVEATTVAYDNRLGLQKGVQQPFERLIAENAEGVPEQPDWWDTSTEPSNQWEGPLPDPIIEAQKRTERRAWGE